MNKEIRIRYILLILCIFFSLTFFSGCSGNKDEQANDNENANTSNDVNSIDENSSDADGTEDEFVEDDGVIKHGDRLLVSIKYKDPVDNEDWEEEEEIILGEDDFAGIEIFSDNLVGKKVGDSVDVSYVIPDTDDYDEEYRGKEVLFHLLVLDRGNFVVNSGGTSEKGAEETGGFFVKQNDRFYSLQRSNYFIGGDLKYYDCDSNNVAFGYHISIPKIGRDCELVLFSKSEIQKQYQAVPVIEDFWALPFDATETGLKKLEWHDFGWDIDTASYVGWLDEEDGEHSYFTDHPEKNFIEIIEMPDEDYAEAYKKVINTGRYSNSTNGINLIKNDWGGDAYVGFYEGTKYLTARIPSGDHFFAYDGTSDGYLLDVTLDKGTYATLDTSELPPGFYILRGENIYDRFFFEVI